MARREKLAIFIFCEGESEVEYAKFLKSEFRSVVAIQNPILGTFDKAKTSFEKSPKYRDNASATDEIWFFFDIDEEQGDKEKWEQRLKIIKKLRKLRKKPNIKVRLLMTTACIEYWLYLHYQKIQPQIITSADKEKMENELKKIVPNYKKGDQTSIWSIAEKYKKAISNGEWSIKQIEKLSSPKDDSEDAINEWLYKNSSTFSNVHEALVFLEQLSEK
ncbi:MAG: RloB domain-containing protein [Clostridia bacterium]